MLTIIIPVLNEELILIEKKDYFQNLKQKVPIIFVDGGSHDRTIVIARNYGKVLFSPLGRGIQKNIGAYQAKTKYLFFMNVDTSVTAQTIESIKASLQEGVRVGCLKMSIEDTGLLFKIFSNIVNFRGKYFGILDADLGMFIDKKFFLKIGQFKELPYMEDIVFSKELRKHYKPIMLSNSIHVSSRKWKEKGIIQTFFSYLWAYIQLAIGALKSTSK